MSYWSISKFANLVRGTPTLKMGTTEEWREWTAAAKLAHPVRFWLSDTALDVVQDTLRYPSKKVNDIRWYIHNRYVIKSHQMTAPVSQIKPGEWQEFGDRMLPCLFGELINFVDHQLSYKEKGFTILGITALAEQCQLTYDKHWCEPTDEEWGKYTPQAIGAQEILALYTWWNEVYLHRIDPNELSGWNKLCDRLDAKEDFWTTTPVYTPEESAAAFKLLDEIEQQYKEEDTQMMIRLIQVRGSLWT